VGAPFEIYNFPKTRFVASFVGTLNIVNAIVVDPAAGRITVDGQEIHAARGVADSARGATRAIALRPEALALNRPNGQGNHLKGTIDEVSFLGAIVRINVRFGESLVSIDTFNSPNAPPPRRGDAVTVSFAPEDVLMLEAAG
jgi:putative spermidine/putrescine transport system ATP-binding protein